MKMTHGWGVGILRWRRNRTGRPLFPPQIHWKNIWTLSKFHKTTSECWQPTSGTQKGSPLSLKRGSTYFVFYSLSYVFLKRMGCLSGCLVPSTSIQKLFCGSCSAFKWSFNEFVGEKVVSPPYSSTILRLPPTLAWTIPWTEELAGNSPWGLKESNTTEWLTLLWYFCIQRLLCAHVLPNICVYRPVFGELWWHGLCRWLVAR